MSEWVTCHWCGGTGKEEVLSCRARDMDEYLKPAKLVEKTIYRCSMCNGEGKFRK